MKTCFLPSHRCLTPPSWGTHCDINAIYISLKSTFSGRWQYWTIFIRLVVIASETREMSRNSKRIWPYSGSRSSTVIDLGVNGKPICDFLLIVTLAVSATVFEIFTLIKIENCWSYPSLPCLTPPLRGNPLEFPDETYFTKTRCGYRRHRKMKIS